MGKKILVILPHESLEDLAVVQIRENDKVVLEEQVDLIVVKMEPEGDSWLQTREFKEGVTSDRLFFSPRSS